MNEKLQGKLLEIVSEIQTTTKTAGDFALHQLPEIAQSYVTYGRIYLTILMIVWLLMLAAGLYLIVCKGFLDTKAVDHYGQWADYRSACVVLGGFTVVGAFAVCSIAINEALLVWFAPKVWLLKELAVLVK